MTAPERSLRSRVLSGSRWVFGVKLVDRGLGIASTVILARLLQPSDYGLIAMAMSLVAILEIFRSFNFEAALIQKADVTDEDFDTADIVAALGAGWYDQGSVFEQAATHSVPEPSACILGSIGYLVAAIFGRHRKKTPTCCKRDG